MVITMFKYTHTIVNTSIRLGRFGIETLRSAALLYSSSLTPKLAQPLKTGCTTVQYRYRFIE